MFLMSKLRPEVAVDGEGTSERQLLAEALSTLRNNDSDKVDREAAHLQIRSILTEHAALSAARAKSLIANDAV